MGDKCCGHKKAQKPNNLPVRAIVLLALGLILIIPACEAFLMSGWLGVVFWWGLSAFLVAVIHKDFASNQLYTLGMTGVVLYMLATPLMPALWLLPAVASGLLLMLGLLCFNPEYFSKESRQAVWYQFPSTERVVLLFVILHWGMSLAHFLPLPLLVYPCVIHDGLIALGLFAITQWVKQSMHSHHHTVSDDDEWVTVNGKKTSISELKKGDIFTIDKQKISFPMDLEVQGKSVNYIPRLEEEIKECLPHGIVPATDYVETGTFKCLDDYRPIDERSQSIDDRALSVFMMLALSIAAVAGLWMGWSSASLAIGIQQFCLNLLVACPCVFLIVKPITIAQFKNAVSSLKGMVFRQIPTVSHVHFAVIDRTNTLYFRKEGHEQYQLHDDAKSMLKDLKEAGITIYIASGHSDLDNPKLYQANLTLCNEELDGLVKEIKFKQTEENKQEIVQNLQLYGQPEKPQYPWISRLSRCFIPYKVMFLGEGENDLKAMQQADFSIAVERNIKLDKVASWTWKREPGGALAKIPGLLSGLKQVGRKQIALYTVALLSIVTMLVLVNGGFAFLAGFALPSTWVCMASYASCTLLLAALVMTSQPVIGIVDDAHQNSRHCGGQGRGNSPSRKKYPSHAECCFSTACEAGSQQNRTSSQ